MKSLQRVSDTVNRTVSYVGIAVFLVLILACVMQVFFRFVLNHSLSWTEELARYCFIWMHMLGASLLIEGSGHATVTAVLDLFHMTPYYWKTPKSRESQHGSVNSHVVHQLLRCGRRSAAYVPGPCQNCGTPAEKGG